MIRVVRNIKRGQREALCKLDGATIPETLGCAVSQVKTRQGAYHFDKFELDLRAGELRQDDGRTVRLPEQPFQILVMLLEHSGDVVTREELRKRLWPNDTIVEFEHSISAAMNRLRQALGDSAENPRYIETLSRRGYRWMVPVTWEERPSPNVQAVFERSESEPFGRNLVGKKVSHYRMLEVLGGGGMGIVYKAEDIKLGRRVAVKFLPEELSTDPTALQRFEREAQAASALDHPNICTIYEFGEHEGMPFIVMQLLEGQTVREFIAASSPGNSLMPNDKLLDLAAQIAAGLDAAHRQGIIHRDVKPANIFITKRGEAKILDFGVAKLTNIGDSLDGATEAEGAGSQSPRAPGLTVTGKTMGTASYMSPEQVRGEKLDARTDLFSFGLVLFELATSQRAFPGESATRVHEAILQEAPRASKELNPGLPSGLQKVIGKCLEKDRESRYQTASDLLADLRLLQHDVKPARMAIRTKLTIGTMAVAAAVVLISGRWILRRRVDSAVGPIKVVPLITNSGTDGRPAFSPDGSQIAFMWDGGEENQFDIYVKLIGDGGPPVRLTRSSGAAAGWPVWSPDGHRIAFVRCSDTSQAIFVVPSVGGADRKITETHSCPISVDWSPDGRAIAFRDNDSGQESTSIFLVSLETGKRERLTMPTKLGGDAEPRFSPDGKTLAFVRTHDFLIGDIFVVPIDGGEPRQLTFMGHQTSIGSNFSGLAWTADGKEIVFSAGPMEGYNSSLWRVKVPGGSPEKVSELAGVNAAEPAISRQGHRLSYRMIISNTNIWQTRLSGSNGRATAPVKFISSTRYQDAPQYSPDGGKIVFVSDRSGSSQIWTCDSSGSNPTQLTFTNASTVGTPRWSADGRSILFDSTASGKIGIYRISVDGGTPEPLVVNSHINVTPSASRDGRWIYFGSDRSGEYEVWKLPSGGGPPVQVTLHSGWYPMESTDGKLLYYVKTNLPVDPSSAPATLWAMPVAGGEEQPVTSQLIHSHWAVASNGIYFTDPDTKPLATLKFLDVRTGRISTIATLERHLSDGGQSLAVSPDDRSVLYSQQDSYTTDLMLVENFR